jgi:hypothetical protein
MQEDEMNAPYKGSGPVNVTYARGGEVISTRSRFFKAQDQFRTDIERNDYEKKSKGGELSKLEGDKSLKPVKPKE